MDAINGIIGMYNVKIGNSSDWVESMAIEIMRSSVFVFNFVIRGAFQEKIIAYYCNLRSM